MVVRNADEDFRTSDDKLVVGDTVVGGNVSSMVGEVILLIDGITEE